MAEQGNQFIPRGDAFFDLADFCGINFVAVAGGTTGRQHSNQNKRNQPGRDFLK